MFVFLVWSKGKIDAVVIVIASSINVSLSQNVIVHVFQYY